MGHFLIHSFFDILAVTLAMLSGWIVTRKILFSSIEKTASKLGYGYFYFLGMGSVLGAYIFGTLNLYLSGVEEIGRSILGSILGATLSVELYKYIFNKHRGSSTGYIYVIPFCILVCIGRIGCQLSGLDDNTYGTPTSMPWAWDYGDGIPRHPVPLYESISMGSFLIGACFAALYKRDVFIKYGYYFCVGYYALQRFVWEFFKPYAEIQGKLDLFQVLCLFLILYSIFMIRKVYFDRNRS